MKRREGSKTTPDQTSLSFSFLLLFILFLLDHGKMVDFKFPEKHATTAAITMSGILTTGGVCSSLLSDL